MSEPTDAELIALFRTEGNAHRAFDLIARRHQRRLHDFIRRMVTDPDETKDVLQNVLIKAWNGLPTFRADAQLFSWLYRIAHNECLTHLQRRKRWGLISDARVLEQLTTSLDSSAHFTGTDIERRLQRAVMALPAKQRAVFNMKYFQELKYEEISSITGTSVGALKSSYHIAVKKIEQALTAPDQTLHNTIGPSHQQP